MCRFYLPCMSPSLTYNLRLLLSLYPNFSLWNTILPELYERFYRGMPFHCNMKCMCLVYYLKVLSIILILSI